MLTEKRVITLLDKLSLPFIISLHMTYSATITSKRQLTIPARLYNKMGLEEGQKILISEENGRLCLKPAVGFVEALAGSVIVPRKLYKVDPDEAVRQAKRTRFGRK